MDTFKAVLTNKTIWGNILGAGFGWLAVHWGLNFDTQTQTAVLVVWMGLLNAVIEHWTGPGLGTKTPATNLGATPAANVGAKP